MQRAAAVTEGAVPSKGTGKREQGREVGAEPLERSAPHKHPWSPPQRPAGWGTGGDWWTGVHEHPAAHLPVRPLVSSVCLFNRDPH